VGLLGSLSDTFSDLAAMSGRLDNQIGAQLTLAIGSLPSPLQDTAGNCVRNLFNADDVKTCMASVRNLTSQLQQMTSKMGPAQIGAAVLLTDAVGTIAQIRVLLDNLYDQLDRELKSPAMPFASATGGNTDAIMADALKLLGSTSQADQLKGQLQMQQTSRLFEMTSQMLQQQQQLLQTAIQNVR
jgi:hypothetical protein